ncbi:MAG: hypothetical protein JSV37_07160 [Anaerolineaceae bacterium]|nr:MAG: hypothetical protein JSV37_07160 [Anaerolineaceae bacterium]
MKDFRTWLPWVGGVIVVSGIIAALDSHGTLFSGWPAYLILVACMAAVIWLAWRWVAEGESPRFLIVALVVAIALRLGLGIAFTYALPQFGYDEEPQRAGYVYSDAFTRDIDAWSLAASDQNLLTAFTESPSSDQYGGLLFLSAFIYRFLSPDIHRPLLIVVIATTISSLAVLFTFRFTKMTFGAKAATLAVWLIVLYPDAVLLGSSQMREAFIGTAFGIALFGYGVLREGHLKKGLLAILLAIVVLALPISPPYAVAILLTVGIGWLWEGRLRVVRSRWLLLPILGLALVAIILAVRAWSAIGGLSGSGMEVLLDWWRSVGGQWQRDTLWMQSDWTRRLLKATPEWAQLPFFTIYGLIRPFLPAALIDRGLPIWRSIAIWRGLGWIVLLPFLLYAPLAAIRGKGWRSLPAYLSVMVWFTALLASYRGTGDLWDNPRYRAAFLAAQVALAGWAWINAEKVGSLWLKRTFVLVGVSMALFTVWYGFRYNLLPYFSVLHAVGVVIAFIVLFLSGSILYDSYQARKSEA